jgi:hypothetical protein
MRHYHRIAFIVLMLLTLGTSTVCAQSPTSLEDNRKWFVRTVVGTGQIHPWDDWAEWVDIRVGRKVGAGSTSIDFGIAGSGSRAAFMSLTGGVEAQPWHAKRVSPFLRGELGILGESDYGGWIVGCGGGAVVRLTPRVGLRTGVALNAHGGVRGPVTTYGGLEFRW